MNKTIRKASLSTILLITMLAITATAVFAGLGVWYYLPIKFDISGNSDAKSGKMVADAYSNYWTASIVTFIENPAISLNIGWNWFSGTEICNYAYTQNIQGGSRYLTGTQTANSIWLTELACVGNRYGRSGGKHIATSPGGTNYYKTWNLTELIP